MKRVSVRKLTTGNDTMSRMSVEIASVPEIVANQLNSHLADYLAAGRWFRDLEPRCVITCARGSSDHAALYFKYLTEIRLGIPVCSMGPSVASVYDADLAVNGLPALAISQSGGSTDICAFMSRCRSLGANTLSLVNTSDSLLESVCETSLPMGAGAEQSVAATKTYICSLVALASIHAGWCGDRRFTDAILELPEVLGIALESDWSLALESFSHRQSCLVIARGAGLAIAEEAALKFKETCCLHAEAFSAAEVMHGPVALASAGVPALLFHSRDAGQKSNAEVANFLTEAGVCVHSIVSAASNEADLAASAAKHPLLDPIVQIFCFYRFVESLSALRGLNPDAPALLKKVTVTR